jgi:hypothetical protein
MSSTDFDDLYDISTDEINSYNADKDYYDPDLLNVLMAEVAETDSAMARRSAEEERAKLEQERKRVEEERAKLEQECKRAEEENKRKEEKELRKKQEADKKKRDLRATGRSAHEAIMQTRVDNANIFQTPQQNAVAALTLIDTVIEAASAAVTPLLDKIKTIVAATANGHPSSSARRPTESVAETPDRSRLPPLRSKDYKRPEQSKTPVRSKDPRHEAVWRPRVHTADSHETEHSRQPVHDRNCRYNNSNHQSSPRRPPPSDLREVLDRRYRERERRSSEDRRKSPDDYDDGVPAFTRNMRRVDWPSGFKPTGIDKYDGKTDPESWLTAYTLAIRAAGGDSKAMANYLPVALADSARNWLTSLPRGSIDSWSELRDHFIANFQGTFERPGTHFDLYNVIQKLDESLKDYIRRFLEKRNKIPNITDDVMIAAFQKGVRDELLIGKFGRKPPKAVKQMFETANSYAKSDDAIKASRQDRHDKRDDKPSGSSWRPKKDNGNNNGGQNDRKRKPEDLVATTSNYQQQRPRVAAYDKITNAQCTHHPNHKHAAKDCFIYKQFAEQYAPQLRQKPADEAGPSGTKRNDPVSNTEPFQDPVGELNHIFEGPQAYESKRKQKLTDREVNTAQPEVPHYLRWSEVAITFNRSDHPDRVVHPGRYPLVLDPVVRNIKLKRVLIDGGSALNILFAKTLDEMQIPRSELKPSSAPFHGVIPGLSSTPLGRITLPVTFGVRENFRTKNTTFEVADFEAAYHAIIGRPALAKFMAVPHYTYLIMKMPGPNGVITLRSDVKQAFTCNKESCDMAQSHKRLRGQLEVRLAASTSGEGEVPTKKIAKSGDGDAKTKKIPLDPSDPSKTAVIGAELDPK